VRKVLLEGLIVGLLGALLAFLANAISPRGLELTRNYFPNDQRPLSTPISVTNPAPGLSVTNLLSPLERLSARFHQEGLQLAESNQVIQLFHDPRSAQGLVVFVDARNDEHYQAGHIPGAYQLDHFRVQDYLATALPVCQVAEQIIVYCNGGDCDDSENTALFLRDAGIDKSKLFVYAGGIAEWTTNRMPVESGSRNSGNIRTNN
jgi:rhodanese-related sulfurtransferase